RQERLSCADSMCVAPLTELVPWMLHSELRDHAEVQRRFHNVRRDCLPDNVRRSCLDHPAHRRKHCSAEPESHACAYTSCQRWLCLQMESNRSIPRTRSTQPSKCRNVRQQPHPAPALVTYTEASRRADPSWSIQPIRSNGRFQNPSLGCVHPS